jgi:hypothetical protein
MNNILKLLVFLFAVPVSAMQDNCNGMIGDGNGEVKVKITVVTGKLKRVEGAEVRILKLGPYDEENPGASNMVKGFTDSKGVVVLNPVFDTYSFRPMPSVSSEEAKKNKSCKSYNGFSALGRYLFVKKEGFHGFHIEIDQLFREKTFYDGKQVKGILHVELVEESI